jgi:hypothetical protein
MDSAAARKGELKKKQFGTARLGRLLPALKSLIVNRVITLRCRIDSNRAIAGSQSRELADL